MAKPQKPVLLGRIGAAHGTQGEVRIKTFTGDPMALGDYGAISDKNGNELKILSLRPQKDLVVARIEGIKDRNGAEALNGTELFIDRSQLPDIDDEDEFYQEDLIGCEAVDLEGIKIGTVRAVFNFGGGDLVELGAAGKKPWLVPFTKAAVPHVDMAACRITIDPQAAGMVESEEEREEARKDTLDAQSRKKKDGSKPS